MAVQNNSTGKGKLSVKKIFFIALLMIPVFAFAQQPVGTDTLFKRLDSLKRQSDSAGKQSNNIHATAYNENTRLNGHDYLVLLGSSIKQEFTNLFI